MKKIICLAGLTISIFAISCNKKPATEVHSCCVKESAPAKTAAPHTDRSVYQLTGSWLNQHNRTMQLKQLEGKWQISAMIFTSCGYACPRIVDNMKAIEKQLPDGIRNKVNFLLISFDTRKDTPERLQWYADKNQLSAGWTLLHGDEDEVRMLSMLLDVKYDPLPKGLFNHSNVITVLDENGTVVKRIEGLDINVNQVAADIADLVKGQ